MTITEAERFQMHEALSTAHGKEVGAIIMEHLPPTGWGDVARRSDVADLRVLTTKDLEMVRVALTSDMQALRGEMSVLRADMRSEMHMLFNKQLKWIVGVVISAQALGTGALLAGMKLL